MRVLEHSLARKDVPSETWGKDLLPDYSGIPRSERAARWDVAAAVPKRPSSPQLIPLSNAGFTLSGKLCKAHRKPKCSSCQLMKRGHSFTVEACCQVHHAPDDKLLIECCTSQDDEVWAVYHSRPLL